MSDSDKEKDAAKSDAPNLEDLKGVLGWVQRKKEDSKAKGKPWGWVMGLLAAVVVFIALAFAAYTAWKKGREIAKLKHKIDVDEEEKKQAEADAAIATVSTEVNSLKAKAVRLDIEINDAKAEIKTLEEARVLANKKIDSITSWEDVDNL